MHGCSSRTRTGWDDPSLRPPGGVRFEVLLFGYPLDDPDAPAPDAGPAAPSEPAPRS